jgi:hypothetical protein
MKRMIFNVALSLDSRDTNHVSSMTRYLRTVVSDLNSAEEVNPEGASVVWMLSVLQSFLIHRHELCGLSGEGNDYGPVEHQRCTTREILQLLM